MSKCCTLSKFMIETFLMSAPTRLCYHNGHICLPLLASSFYHRRSVRFGCALHSQFSFLPWQHSKQTPFQPTNFPFWFTYLSLSLSWNIIYIFILFRFVPTSLHWILRVGVLPCEHTYFSFQQRKIQFVFLSASEWALGGSNQNLEFNQYYFEEANSRIDQLINLNFAFQKVE